MSLHALVDTAPETVYRNRFRQARLARFLTIVDEIVAAKGRCRIIDVGGNLEYWQGLDDLWRDRPLHFTLVNLAPEMPPDGRFFCLAGTACDLSQFPDHAFDIVHSNSVIEHVGLWSDQHRMAQEVRRLAPRYFVQTPNFWFPYEPHFRMPFIHWLPEPWRAAIVMGRACGFYPQARSCDQAYRVLQDVRLLTAKAMASLFPDATIEYERFGPLVKSIIAVR
jgi:hypothetical protein